MDGPNLVPSSGGFEVGSAVVTLSLETSGAEQKLAAFQGQLQSLVSGNYSVSMGSALPTGTVTPMPGPGSVSAGMGSFAGGGAFGAQSLQIDTSQATAAVQALKAQVAELSAALVGQLGPAAPSAAAMGYPSGGSGGAGGQWWSRQSYRSLGLPIAAFMGLEAAGHVAQGAYQANYIAAHPEDAMAPYSGSSLASNPNIRAIAGEQQQIEGRLAVKSTIESIPVLGSYLSAFDIGEGSRFELEKRRGRLGREASLIEETESLGYRSSAMEVASTGDQEAIYRQSQAKELADWRQKAKSASEVAFRTGGQLLRDVGWNATVTPEAAQTFGADVKGEAKDYLRVTDEAQKAADGLARFTAAVENTANKIGAMQSAHIASTNAVAGADMTLAGRGFGSAPAAESMLQQSELFVPVAEYMSSLTSGPMGMPSGVGLSQAGANINHILASQAQQSSQSAVWRNRLDSSSRTRAAAAQAGAGGFAHTASMIEFNASSRIAIEDAGRQGVDISGSVNTERQAMEDAARRESDVRSQMSMDRSVVSGLSAQHRDYEASLTQLQSHFAERSRNIRSDAPGAAREQIALYKEKRGAEGRLTAEHEFGLKVANEGYDARITAAHEQEALRPMNASATLDVAHARHEVANASPEERSKVVAANEAELKARKTLLTAQRGGETAVDMSMHEALGMMSNRGVDLTGRDRDIKAAGETYGKGISGLGGAPKPGEGGGPSSGTELAGLVSQILKLMQSGMKGSSSNTWPQR